MYHARMMYRLVSLINIEVITRSGVELMHSSKLIESDPTSGSGLDSPKVTIHTPNLEDISSTMVRNAIPSIRICRIYIFGKNNDEIYIDKALSPSIHRYIRYNKLYCYSVEAVRKRNLSRLYFFLQGIYICHLIYR